SHERAEPRSDIVARSRARGLSLPLPLFFELLELEVRRCCGHRLQSSDEPRNRTEYFRIPGIRDTSPGLGRRLRWCWLPGLAWPETSAIPSPADSLKLSDIAPSGLRKSTTGEEIACRVVYVSPHESEKRQVGVDFIEPCPRFWRISFPPSDWSTRSPEAKGNPTKQK